MRWCGLDEVDRLPLHPGFARVVAGTAAGDPARCRIVVDMANVVGSRPDGWWHDRAGANARLRQRITALAGRGHRRRQRLPAGPRRAAGDGLPGLGAGRRRRRAAPGRRADDSRGYVATVAAPGSGDDEIVRPRGRLGAAGPTVVVTSDRELRAR